MSTSIREDSGPIRIVLTGGNSARFFGIPLLIAGGWLGYHLVLSLFELATGQSGPEFIPGAILLVVMTAAFFLPGWMLMAARSIVEIDRVTRTVTAVRDLRFYKRRERRSLSEFSRIEVDVLTISPRGKPVRAYRVELAADTRRNQVVGLFNDPDEALAHGQRLGALLGFDVKDLRYVETDAE